ncbi:hypothetical protein DY000_02038038 [Brassica cretica]|uniref:Uncharacterized protein n=1 Tax=Brassica cretica TaxID=69181 RepID=A0ABQ7BGB4_BRACR|nr:hypothetical protein DY000_02038038 [Brassica cretica]
MLQAGIQTTQMDRLRFKDSDWTGQADGNGVARRLQWRESWPVLGWRWIEGGIRLAGLMSLSSWIDGLKWICGGGFD